MFLSPFPVDETFEVGGRVEPENFEEIYRNYLSILSLSPTKRLKSKRRVGPEEFQENFRSYLIFCLLLLHKKFF